MRVFEYNGKNNQWRQLGQRLEGVATQDRFGASVALSANGAILAVGARHNDANGISLGHVRVFEYNSGTDRWNQFRRDLEGEAAGDKFGGSVALSADGTTLAAGSTFNDGNGVSSGHVHVFGYNRNTNQWDQFGQDLDGKAAGDQFGISVALSADGSIVAAGADQYNETKAVGPGGYARVVGYNRTTDRWDQLGEDLDDKAGTGRFGFSVALSADGTTLVTSASGRVHAFEYLSETKQWVPFGQDLDREAVGICCNWSVALSADGTIVAVGAPFHDGGGLNSSGHVRVFAYKTETKQWIQLGQDLSGEASDDWFGQSVSLSANGTVVAAGAWRNDGNGDFSGHVRVFLEQ